MALGGLDNKTDHASIRIVKVHREPWQRLLAKLDEVDKDTRAEMSGADGGSGDHEDEDLVVRSTGPWTAPLYGSTWAALATIRNGTVFGRDAIMCQGRDGGVGWPPVFARKTGVLATPTRPCAIASLFVSCGTRAVERIANPGATSAGARNKEASRTIPMSVSPHRGQTLATALSSDSVVGPVLFARACLNRPLHPTTSPTSRTLD